MRLSLQPTAGWSGSQQLPSSTSRFITDDDTPAFRDKSERGRGGVASKTFMTRWRCGVSRIISIFCAESPYTVLISGGSSAEGVLSSSRITAPNGASVQRLTADRKRMVSSVSAGTSARQITDLSRSVEISSFWLWLTRRPQTSRPPKGTFTMLSPQDGFQPDPLYNHRSAYGHDGWVQAQQSDSAEKLFCAVCVSIYFIHAVSLLCSLSENYQTAFPHMAFYIAMLAPTGHYIEHQRRADNQAGPPDLSDKMMLCKQTT